MVPRVSVWLLADQLCRRHPALIHVEEKLGVPRDEIRVVLVESRAALQRLRYHRIRQVLHLSAGRHYAAELARRGYIVDLIAADDTGAGLRDHVSRHRPERLIAMMAAETCPPAVAAWSDGR